jgi:membrane protein YqaA with SNARE-associated domain
MNRSPSQIERPAYRARFKNRRTFLLVESLAIVLLVAGVLWLVQNYTPDGQLARGLVDPRIWLLVFVASGFGTAGGLVPYYIGQRGKQEVFERYPQLEGKRWDRIQATFQRWGARTLILSGVPTLGLALLVAAGAFAIRRSAFVFWVFLGKAFRNGLVAISFLLGVQLIV